MKKGENREAQGRGKRIEEARVWKSDKERGENRRGKANELGVMREKEDEKKRKE